MSSKIFRLKLVDAQAQKYMNEPVSVELVYHVVSVLHWSRSRKVFKKCSSLSHFNSIVNSMQGWRVLAGLKFSSISPRFEVRMMSSTYRPKISELGKLISGLGTELGVYPQNQGFFVRLYSLHSVIARLAQIQ